MEVWSATVSFKPTVLDPEGRVAKLGEFFRVSSLHFSQAYST